MDSIEPKAKHKSKKERKGASPFSLSHNAKVRIFLIATTIFKFFLKFRTKKLPLRSVFVVEYV
jgi:hypothetical protein